MHIVALFFLILLLSDKIGLLSTSIPSILFGLYIVISVWKFVNMGFESDVLLYAKWFCSDLIVCNYSVLYISVLYISD